MISENGNGLAAGAALGGVALPRRLNVAQLRVRLGTDGRPMPLRTVRSILARGEIGFFKLGNRLVIPIEEVDRYEQARMRLGRTV